MTNALKNFKKRFDEVFIQAVSARDQPFSLEHNNFNALLLSAALFSIISFIFNLLEDFSLGLKLFNAFASVVLSYLYYLSRFKNFKNIWITLITISAILSVLWFMNNGTLGSTSFIYIVTIMLFVTISGQKQQKWIFLLFVINIAVLYVLEYYWGEHLVYPYSSKTMYYSDIIFVFILVLLSVFFFTRFIKRSYDSERNKVKMQKSVIEEKNKELLSSITYASYLQKKIIPNEMQLNLLFKDYFVLFKPKDIVSGDFYWIKDKGHYGIVVVADCTGHGVPAAFLGILGISLFEEIIKQEAEDLNAADILEKLRLKFIAHLQRNDQQARDGIDLGICIVNYRDYTLQFAGANRNLIMIRDNKDPEAVNCSEKEVSGNRTLFSFTGTKNTIGFNYKEFPFINYEIEFFPADTFYIFSDGYGDQFSSHDKKKFKVGRLKKELMKIQDLPMATQGEYLDNLHKEWKGEAEQTDDILMIGLRV